MVRFSAARIVYPHFYPHEMVQQINWKLLQLLQAAMKLVFGEKSSGGEYQCASVCVQLCVQAHVCVSLRSISVSGHACILVWSCVNPNDFTSVVWWVKAKNTTPTAKHVLVESLP